MTVHFARILTVVCLLFGLESFFASAPRIAGAGAVQPRLATSSIANGHTLLVELAVQDAVASDQIVLRRETASVRAYPRPGRPAGTYFALIGMPYETAPKRDTLSVAWAVADLIYTADLPVRVVGGPYGSESIQGVDQSRVTPGADDLKRIAWERDVLTKAYAAIRDSVIMDGPFAWPVENRLVTSAYGTRRIFNGQLRSYHGGLDLRAREGTPIFAAQSGVVKLARNLFYAGNHVLIEHGMGLHSSYSHLSRIDVEEGQWIKKGRQVGLAGATGRVNAAHLHWTISVNGVGVSPAQAFEVVEGVFR